MPLWVLCTAASGHVGVKRDRSVVVYALAWRSARVAEVRVCGDGLPDARVRAWQRAVAAPVRAELAALAALWAALKGALRAQAGLRELCGSVAASLSLCCSLCFCCSCLCRLVLATVLRVTLGGRALGVFAVRGEDAFAANAVALLAPKTLLLCQRLKTLLLCQRLKTPLLCQRLKTPLLCLIFKSSFAWHDTCRARGM